MNRTGLRIVFVSNNYTPYSGGVVSSIMATMHELRKAGHEVFLITLDFIGNQQADDPYLIRIACPVRFKYNNNHMAIPWRPDAAVYKIIASLKPDIIHSHHPFLLGVSAAKAAKKLTIPIVFTVHTMYETLSHNVPLPEGITRFAIQKLVRTYCKTINCIIAPTTSIVDYVRRQGIDTATMVVPSGLQSIFVPEKKPQKQCSKKQCNLLVVSRFSLEKNIKFLIDMFVQLPQEYVLTLIGYGPEYEQLRTYAYTHLKLSPERIVFIHQPDKHVIATAYKQADIFLFASLTDVQPLVLIEAMAGATPVVALKGPGRDVIRDGYNGFIVDDALAMVAVIIKITHDDVLREELYHNAWLTGQQYAPHITTQRLIAGYNAVIVQEAS